MGVYRTQVRLSYPGPGSPGFNAFHFRLPGSDDGAPDTPLQAASDALEDFFTGIRNRIPTGVTISSDALWSRVDQEALARDLTGWSLTGSGEGSNCPALCYMLGSRTSRPGRTGRGRTFLGPTSLAAVAAGGVVSDDVRAEIVSDATASLITPFTGAGDGAFVVWSVKSRVGSDITAFEVDNQFAVLRSRRD